MIDPNQFAQTLEKMRTGGLSLREMCQKFVSAEGKDWDEYRFWSAFKQAAPLLPESFFMELMSQQAVVTGDRGEFVRLYAKGKSFQDLFAEASRNKTLDALSRRLMADYGVPLEFFYPGASDVFKGDILSQIASTRLHILLACMTQAGKSTTMRAILFLKHKENPATQFLIVDPKTGRWMGLESDPSTVHYVSGDALTVLQQVNHAVSIAFEVLDERIKEIQRIRREMGRVTPDYHPFVLVIDEWTQVVQLWLDTPQSLRTELGLDRMMGKIKGIIRQGAELNVQFFGIGQSHNAGEIGISAPLRRSMAIVAQGFIQPNGDGSFIPIQGLIRDAYVFPDQDDRQRLAQILNAAKVLSVKEGVPVVLTTMGEARIGLLPKIPKEKIDRLEIKNYRYRGALPRQWEPDDSQNLTAVSLSPAKESRSLFEDILAETVDSAEAGYRQRFLEWVEKEPARRVTWYSASDVKASVFNRQPDVKASDIREKIFVRLESSGKGRTRLPDGQFDKMEWCLDAG